MIREMYCYWFSSGVPLEDVKSSLLLAIWGAESLHGEAQVRLDAAIHIDDRRRACVIDAASPVGRDLNRLFVGFVRREFDSTAFRVERISVVHANRMVEEVLP